MSKTHQIEPDQRAPSLRLKRVFYETLAQHGVELPIPPDGPAVRMVDQKLVRKAFYACTPEDGTPELTQKSRYMQFTRALARAEVKSVIGIGEIDGVTYLWPAQPDLQDAEQN